MMERILGLELPVMGGCVVGRKWATVEGVVFWRFCEVSGEIFFFDLEIWFNSSWSDVDWIFGNKFYS